MVEPLAIASVALAVSGRSGLYRMQMFQIWLSAIVVGNAERLFETISNCRAMLLKSTSESTLSGTHDGFIMRMHLMALESPMVTVSKLISESNVATVGGTETRAVIGIESGPPPDHSNRS